MRWTFTHQEIKARLLRNIQYAKGRHRELLNVLYNAYPEGLSEGDIMQKLNIVTLHNLHTVTRNANAVSELDTHVSRGGAVNYRLCDQRVIKLLLHEKVGQVMGSIEDHDIHRRCTAELGTDASDTDQTGTGEHD
ncbi:hypothetical protein RCJ22_39585 [Vibrio sp. FNV 38]|nr:hypothetical protein [Vibrio sp. FNV 38]